MKVIILNAGIGKRLGIKSLPKCLLSIKGETLLERQLRILREVVSPKDIVIVIGSQGECWSKKNINKIKHIHRRVVINKKNTELNRCYSLYCALKDIKNEDVVVLDGDLIFEADIIKRFINDPRKNLLLAGYTESRYSRGKGARIEIGENKVIKIGYKVGGNIVYLGIFKIRKEDLKIFKKFLIKKNWDKGLNFLLDSFIQKRVMYVFLINPVACTLVAEKYATSEIWSAFENKVIKIRNKVRKETRRVGKQRLINEFNFIQGLPQEIKKYFPQIISHNFSGESVYYEMKYYPYPSFIDLIFKQKISPQKSLEILEKILDFMFYKFYRIKEKVPPKNFIRISYFNKIFQRYRMVDSRFKLFKKIVEAKYLTINGRKMQNFFPIIERMEKNSKFLGELEPPLVALFHGDFKFDNMLIDLKTRHFILIDPRGLSTTGSPYSDILEDMAKLMTSCHSYYDLFLRGFYKLRVLIDKKNRIIIYYKVRNKKVIQYFDQIYNNLIKLLPKYDQIKQDLNWQKRLAFIETMLLLANAPFHLTSKQREKLSIVLLIRGVELLNNFIQKYPLDCEEQFKIININRVEDFQCAKRIFEEN